MICTHRTDIPGAKALNVHHFILKMVDDCQDKESQQQFISGLSIIEKAVKEKYPNIKVVKFSELTAEFARKNGARYLLRGLRNTTDFEYENSISQVNRQLYPELESVFLITTPRLAWISSSIVREVHRYGGDVSGLLPYKLHV